MVRGYLAGSAYKEYQVSSSVSSIPLSQNLKLADRLREPIFAPATKTNKGHDINIGKEEIKKDWDKTYPAPSLPL